MSAGYGPPIVNTFGMITGIGDAFTKSYDAARKEKLTSDLGSKIKTGDYAGAAQAALDAGDLQTGLALVKMGETRGANQQLSETLGGLFGGGQPAAADAGAGGGAGTGKFGDMIQGRQAPAPLPSFADQSGPAGSYVANLFKRESNNNSLAQAPTSSARGLGQFTKDTWNGLGQKYPDLALTPVGGGQDGRIDPDQMLRATKAFTADNEAILSRANLPVNDATRYSLHLLGAGGGPKFVAGAVSNPDAPAIGLVRPEQVRANRSIFFGKDGRPKTAGEVLASFGASFGGGRGGGGAPAAPALPSNVLASADEANLPVAGGENAEFFVPPAASPGRVMTMPSDAGGAPSRLGAPAPYNTAAPGSGSVDASAGAGVGTAQASLGAPAAPAAPSAPGVPGASAPSVPVSRMDDFTTTAGPMAAARIPIRNIADVNRTSPGSPERVKALIRATLIPGLSEQQQGLVKTLLSNEMEQSKLTTDQRDYALAQSQGFQGGFLDFKNAIAGRQDEGAKIGMQVAAREAEAQRRGLDLKAPSTLRYTLTGNMAEERPDRTPDAVLKVNDALTNWQKYRLPDPNNPANEKYWNDFSAKTLGGQGGTTVNVDTKGESEEAKELGKERGKRAATIEAAAMKAPDQIGKLDLLGRVLDRASTGSFGPAESTIVGFAQAAGIPDTTIAAAGLNPQQAISSQAATKLINEAVTGMIGAGGFPSNNFSNSDREFLTDIFPKMSNRPEANRMALEVMKRVQQRSMEMGDAWAEYQQTQREAGKPTSVAEFEFNFRKGLRDKPGLFDDIRSRVDTLPSGEASASPTKFDPAKTKVSMEDGKALKAAPDTAENRQLFDQRYGDGAALAILKRPLASSAAPVAGGGSNGAPAAPSAPRNVQVGRAQQSPASARAADPSKPSAPPIAGSKLAPDGRWYVPDPARPGKYLEVQP